MFWGLLVIAFNTMAQPTGRVCDGPAHINAQLRISPIECAIDTFFMIGRLLYYSFYSYNSFARGATAVITDRFFFDDEEFGYVAEVQGSTTLRVLLAVATFTQAVKILCCENVVLTKVWAGIYITHWVCGEVLLIIKRRMKVTLAQATDHRRDLSSHGIGSLSWTVVAFAATFPLFFGALGTSGLMKHSTGRDWSPIQCIGVVVLAFGCIPFTIASAYALYVRDRPRACGLALLTILVPGVFYLIPIFTKTTANTSDTITPTYIATVTLVVIWVSCGYWWAVQTLQPLFEHANVRAYVRPIETGLSWWLVLVHLLSAYIYYQYAYPVQGKIRPSWSEFLG